MAFDNIDAPDEFLGIGKFTTGGSNPRERVPHDKAHLIGDNLWDRRIKDGITVTATVLFYVTTFDDFGHGMVLRFLPFD